jgi:hypothetical protein
MEPMASQVRNHYSQKNQEAQLERALARALMNTANYHCWSNVWTSNPAFEYSVGDLVKVRAIVLMKQDDDDTNQEISNDKSEDLGVSTMFSDIEEDDLHYRQQVLHLDQASCDKTIRATRVPL